MTRAAVDAAAQTQQDRLQLSTREDPIVSARDDITSNLRNMVHAVLREESAEPDYLIYRNFDGEIVDPSVDRISYPEPADMLAAIKVANTIAGHARGLANDYMQKARGAGRTWLELADALGVDKDEEDRALEAFRIAAHTPSQRFDEVYAWWRCASCQGGIRDTGPYGGHPDDNETGHTDTCARHRAEVALYMADWDD